MSLGKLIKYNNIFVETGSHKGDGIQQALDVGYGHVRSIEINDHYYDFCKNRFSGNDRVKLYKGSSAQNLKLMIEDIKEPITFWLDGHYSQNDPEQIPTGDNFPILNELNQIVMHPIKSHVIMIDDIREKYLQSILYMIKSTILSINSKYVISFMDCTNKEDILLAKLP
jgi:hypothetical protein